MATIPATTRTTSGWSAADWVTPKPAATALRTLTQRLDNATFVRQLDLMAGNRAVVNDFEGEQQWHAWGDGAAGAVEHLGRAAPRRRASGKVSFSFFNSGKAYIDFQNSREAPGQPRRLGVWVHGDSSGHLIWATFRDADDEFFRVFLCAIGPGWQTCEAALADAEYSDGDGVVQYPIRFQSLIVDNEPDGTNGGGTIYLDDLYVEDGPEMHGYRYDRAGRNRRRPVDGRRGRVDRAAERRGQRRRHQSRRPDTAGRGRRRPPAARPRRVADLRRARRAVTRRQVSGFGCEGASVPIPNASPVTPDT